MDGEEYEYNYCVGAKHATVTVTNGIFTSTDDVTVDCDLVTMSIQKELTDEHTITITVSGVNMSGSDTDIFVSVGEEELASFTIKTRPPQPSITINRPESGDTYDKSGMLAVNVTVSNPFEGFDYDSDVTFTLNNEELTYFAGQQEQDATYGYLFSANKFSAGSATIGVSLNQEGTSISTDAVTITVTDQA